MLQASPGRLLPQPSTSISDLAWSDSMPRSAWQRTSRNAHARTTRKWLTTWCLPGASRPVAPTLSRRSSPVDTVLKPP